MSVRSYMGTFIPSAAHNHKTKSVCLANKSVEYLVWRSIPLGGIDVTFMGGVSGVNQCFERTRSFPPQESLQAFVRSGFPVPW